MDAQGRKVKTTCVGCGVVYVDGVTDIAPCIVVGPEYRDDIGQKPWVCLEHWRHSINRVQVDEVTLDQTWKNTKSLHNLNSIYFSYTGLFLGFTKEIAGKIKKFTQI